MNTGVAGIENHEAARLTRLRFIVVNRVYAPGHGAARLITRKRRSFYLMFQPAMDCGE